MRYRFPVTAAFLMTIDEFGNSGYLVDYLAGPVRQLHRLAVAPERQTRLPAPFRRQCLVLQCLLVGYGIEWRTVLEQAVNEKRLHEAHCILVDTRGIGDVDVQGANFDVFDAAAPERRRRTLARLSDALRPNRAVVLVLDLQLVGAQLLVLAVPDNAYFFIGGLGRPDRLAEIADVLVQPVQ